MKRFFKVFGLLVLILLVVIVGVIGYLALTVDLDQVKQRISAEVKKQTGRELVIAGDLELSFFPWVGIEIGQTRLGNPAGFQGDFVSFEQAHASIRLIPLFSKQVEMSRLLLDGFTLNLVQRKDGFNNWDDLAAGGEGHEKKQTEKQSEPSGTTAAAGAFMLDGIEIRNAGIVYDDRKAGTRVELTRFNLTTERIDLKRDIPFQISFALNLTEPNIKGDYTLDGVAFIDPDGPCRIRDIVFSADLQLANQPIEQVEASLNGNLNLDQEHKRLTFDPLQLQVALTGDALPEKPTRIKLNTVLNAEMESTTARLQPLQLEMPGSRMTGEATFARKGEEHRVDFSMAFDQIDLARFVPPAGQEEPVPEPKEQPKSQQGQSDQQGLRNLVVNGDLTIGRLVQENLLITDIAMRLKMVNGVLRVNPFTAKLYGGLANQDILVDLRPAAPEVKVKALVKGFQIGDYLQASMEKDLLSGTADVKADINLTAADAESIKKSLNGTAAFNVRNGALKGVNIPDMIRRAKAALAGETIPPASLQQTDFTELSGTALIRDGVVNNDDLSMKSPLLRITGNGNADLPQERVNYLVTAKIVGTTKGQGGADLQELAGLPIPIRIKGSLSEPDWKLDLAAAMKGKVEQQVKGVIDEAMKDPEKAMKDPGKLLEEPKKTLEGLKDMFK